MKKPLSPPSFESLIVKHKDRLGEIFNIQLGPAPGGKYLHWDKLRHLDPPESLGVEEWWLGVKFSRTASKRCLPLVDTGGRPFYVVQTPQILEALHTIDSLASGRVALPEPVTNESTRARFLFRSLVEEAITSSQLEGAATTRKQAMEMIRSGRNPANKSERMIFNNLQGMKFIRENRETTLTPKLVLEIHRRMTVGTLPDAAIGRVQTPDDNRIHVGSNATGEILHEPPPANTLAERMVQMCRFANKESKQEFLHPVIRAILLHLWLGYDHPFEDGNGRTARALFYWLMLHEGYWLFEFISISAILKRASASYGRSYLYSETDENDATYFVDFQLDAIQTALRTMERYLVKKTKQIEAAERALITIGGFNYRQLSLLGHALRNPDAEYTVNSHKVSHQVAYATARSDLLDLVKRGLLEERKIGKANGFFPAQRLLNGLNTDGK